MANRSPAEVVERVQRRDYSAAIRGLDANAAFAKILEAIETFEQTPAEFYPYSSKFDAVLAGKAQFTLAEHRGVALFTNPAKGNCARCHPSDRGSNGEAPQFTDYGYAALGVPRNPAIAANSNPAWFDLGLCGPERPDLRSHTEYCGRFLTPTLRNVATRQVFFHNGAVHSLKDAVAFYATRDSDAARWYPHGRFDDLAAAYRANVETAAPFGHAQASLSAEEIGDIVAFLETLTDGWKQ
jgi:cytochrome c peroxidase